MGPSTPRPTPTRPPHPGLAAAHLRRVSLGEPWDQARPHALLLSLGMGGSSAAALLSPAPSTPPKEGGLGATCPQPKPPALLTLSAHTPNALAQAQAELADHLHTAPHANPDEVAATLREGRAWLPHRRAWVSHTTQEAAKRLDDGDGAAGEALSGCKRAWLCAGLEPWSCWPVAQLGRDPRFVATLDASLDTLRRLLGQDLRPLVHASADRPEDPMRWAFGRVHAFRGLPTPAQHGLHAALLLAQAALWGHVGAHPDLLLGYSLGECVAASLAGLWSHEDALWFIVERARLLDKLPPGAMISVLGGDEALALPEGFTVAAQLGAGHRVIAGPAQGAEAAQRALRALGLTHQRLQGQAHALHTPHALPCAAQIGRLAEQLRPSPPTPRWLAGADGRDLDPARAASADHWFEHATRPVRLDLGLSRLLDEPRLRAWITLGPGDALARVAAHEAMRRPLPSPTFVHAWDATEPKPWARWLGELGRLWVVGALPEDAAWPYDPPTTRRTALPPTPFARRRFFPEDAAPLPDHAHTTDATHAATHATPTPPQPPPPAAPEDPAQPPRLGADTRAHLLAKLWAQSFGVERVGLEDHFFAMGGHSLLALQLLVRVQRAFGVELPLRLLWEHPTPARMERAWSDWERSEARAQEARAQEALRAASDDERPALLRAWLGLALSALLKLPAPPAPHAPLPLAAHLPALLAALRPLTDAPLYPHELEACDTLETLARLLEHALAPQPTRAPTLSRLRGRVAATAAGRGGRVAATAAGRGGRVAATAAGRGGRGQAPAFILSSARSGSTLLRVLLAGHTGLFAPPELHLWGYDDLAQRAAGMLSPSLAGGLARAWGEARGLSLEAARAEVNAWEAEGLSVREADARLRAACAPRALVDKSPDYAEDPKALRALREAHPDALLVHLVRHPRAVMESYVRRRMDALSRRDGALDPWSKAEAHWATCNQNILDLLDQRPGPSARVHYEDLVRRPEETLRRLCGALGVRYEPQMLRLEVGLRMRDGPGDPGFGGARRAGPQLGRRVALVGPAAAAKRPSARPPAALGLRGRRRRIDRSRQELKRDTPQET
jgi:phthiocerol/phenolphthiocerol synthesis type-I polyketide synthase E